MTPISIWRHLFLPPSHQWNSEQTRYVDTLVFFTLLSFLLACIA